MRIEDSEVVTLEAALRNVGLLGRIKLPSPAFRPAEYEVIKVPEVCASGGPRFPGDGRDDTGRLFVLLGGGRSLFQWPHAGGKPGRRYSLQGGWAVVVVVEGRDADLHLVQYA